MNIASVHSIPKIAYAKKILRDLNQRYRKSFIEQSLSLGENFSEKQRFLTLNLLYLAALADKSENTTGHSQLVAGYTLLLTKSLRIEDKKFLTTIVRGALLHDIGKIGIPEAILRKKSPLTSEEREIIKAHPLLGYEMIKEFNFLKKPAQVVLYHHEQYEGSGYPYGLAGEEIPIEARIFALADTLDALTSDRSYRKGMSFEKALVEIEKNKRNQFDPFLMDVLLSLPIKKLQQIRERTYEFFSFYLIH